MVKGKEQKKEEEKIRKPLEVGIYIGNELQVSPLVESIAKYLWIKYDRTRLTDDWNRETPQRKVRWITDAENIRGLVDEYYEE